MDLRLKCLDCGEEFIFTENEQDFYKAKNFPNPKRCKFCRHARKIKKGGYKNGK